MVVDHDATFISESCDRVLAMNFGRQLSIRTPAQVLSARGAGILPADVIARAEKRPQ
jgi:hypothetical protein